MEIYTNTMTAQTPSFGMPSVGHPCADVRATDVRVLGVDVAAAQGGVAVIDRAKGAFPVPPAWSPPTS